MAKTAIVRTKDCICEATSSGPRAIVASERSADGRIVMRAEIAGMAYNQCDRPWKVEAQAEKEA